MSSVFIFELESVLEQRLRIERQKQKEVAEAEAQRVAVEERIRVYQGAIMAAKQVLREHLAAEKHDADDGRLEARVALHTVRMQAGASLQLVARAQQAVLELAGVHKLLDARRLELLKASADRRAVELLRERRHEEWRKARNRREQAELDDICAARRPGREQVT